MIHCLAAIRGETHFPDGVTWNIFLDRCLAVVDLREVFLPSTITCKFVCHDFII